MPGHSEMAMPMLTPDLHLRTLHKLVDKIKSLRVEVEGLRGELREMREAKATGYHALTIEVADGNLRTVSEALSRALKMPHGLDP